MEFTNEIFFNKPLTAGSTVILTYSGQLYREHSKDVSIVYGYGDDWAETDNALMTETENGFEVTLEIKDYNKFNFCFTNSFNIWDNNFGCNYICPILPKDSNKEEDKEDTQEEIKQEQTEEQVEEAPVQEEAESEASNAENFTETENPDIETAFASLLDSILDDTNNNNETIDISNLSGFGLQSVDEIKEEDMVNCDSIFAELFEELTDDQTVQREEVQKAEITNYDNFDAKELDNLMDNLLTSIADDNETADYATPVQEIEEKKEDYENAGLPVVQEKEDWVDKIINVSYKFSKGVVSFFKKLGKLVGLNSAENVNDENK